MGAVLWMQCCETHKAIESPVASDWSRINEYPGGVYASMLVEERYHAGLADIID